MFNVLLQVMDHGTLDRQQRQEDRLPPRGPDHDQQRRRARISRDGRSASASATASGRDDDRAARTLFSPEFRNRLDARIAFDALDAGGDGAHRRQVHEGARRAARRARRDASSSPTPRASYLAEKGYDKDFGARPLARLIQDEIKRPLGDELLFGKLEHGGHVLVDQKDGELVFEKQARPPEPSDGPKLLN